MNEAQLSAAKSLKTALRKVAKANLILRVYDGSVFVAPDDVNLWPDGPDGNVISIMNEYGLEVTPKGLDADGGAGV